MRKVTDPQITSEHNEINEISQASWSITGLLSSFNRSFTLQSRGFSGVFYHDFFLRTGRDGVAGASVFLLSMQWFFIGNAGLPGAEGIKHK